MMIIADSTGMTLALSAVPGSFRAEGLVGAEN
jgi:hypothetical protein